MSDYDPNYVLVKNYALIGLKGVIFGPEGKILLLKRSGKTSGAGKWSLPGGYLEDGEEPEEGMKRELSEETGITLDSIRAYMAKSFRENGDFVVVIGFRGISKTVDVNLNWEHTDFKWVFPDEAIKMDLSLFAKFFVKNVDA